jgi:Auxiliary Activity family 9 (formerly GH61)
MGQIGTSGTSVRRAFVPRVLSYTNLLLRRKNSTVNGQSISVTLPSTISPGGYLVRHEIIALHLAVTLGGAEFYPSCTQILVGGSQTGTPDQTVSFPGAYNDNDPGIYDPDVYDPNAVYTFPGPPLSNLASSSGDSGSGTTTGETPTSTSASGTSPTAQPTSDPSSSNAICKLKKRDTTMARHKRRAGFRRAIRDAFHYS